MRKSSRESAPFFVSTNTNVRDSGPAKNYSLEYPKKNLHTVKSRLSERRLSETTGLFEDDGQSRIFSLLSIAIKLPIIRISIIRKIQFFEVIRRSRLKKLLLNYPSRFEVQMSRMVIMISLFGRARFTHLSELAKQSCNR